MIQAFILCLVVASCLAGFLHRDLPPFSRYNTFAQIMPVPTYAIRLRAAVADGKEYDIDARAWEPQSTAELVTWLDFEFPKLDPASQERVGKYLLEQANVGRTEVLAGQRLGVFSRYFGPLTAPQHVMFRKIWVSRGDVPQAPFERLMIYREWWDQHERALDPNRYRRDLIYEYPRP